MKKTRILVPALAILALGMAASVTGTVAWFSMNTQVQADGMRISSVTSKSLMISLNQDSGYTTAVTVDATKANILPVSPVYNNASLEQAAAGTTVTAAPGFIRVNLATNDVADPAVSAAEYTIAEAYTANKVGSNAESDYYLIDDGSNYASDDIWLLYSGDAEHPTSAINGTIICTRGSDFDLDDAFRVGILDLNNSKMYVWSPFVGQTGTEVTINVNNFMTLSNGAAEKLTLYSWFEGTDAECTTQNSINTQNLSTTFKWALAE